MKKSIGRYTMFMLLCLVTVLATRFQPKHPRHHHIPSAEEISTLRPPAGAHVAVVAFEDLQCPACASEAAVLEEAARRYQIPVVRHDFPLSRHSWSLQAAILARHFDTQSKQLGNQFRDAVFEHQAEITPGNLRAFAEKYASDSKVNLPSIVDPDGQLAAQVKVDRGLGQKIGIDHTPTVYVVSDRASKLPFVEVMDADREQLFRVIDDVARD